MRQLAIGGLVALSLVAMPRAHAQEDAMWAGCALEVRTGSVRTLHCDGVDVSLSHAPIVADDTWLDSISTRGAAGTPIVRESLPVDGRMIVLRILERDRPRVIAAARADVVVVCDAHDISGLERCRAGITWVARHGLPPGVRFPEARRDLLGRPLVVPHGCELIGSERISCPSGFAFGWRSGSPHNPAAVVTAYGELLRGRFPRFTSVDVSCSIGGRRGTGARFVLAPRAQTIVCVVPEGNGSTFAQCLGDLRPGEPWPEPCSQIFDGTIPP